MKLDILENNDGDLSRNYKSFRSVIATPIGLTSYSVFTKKKKNLFRTLLYNKAQLNRLFN